MKDKIEIYLGSLFEQYEGTKNVSDLKHDLHIDLNDRYEDLLLQGKSEQEAYEIAINSIGDIEDTLRDMANLTQKLERQLLTNFNAQDLSETDFKHVVVPKGKFDASSIKNADFTGADLTGSSFKSSDVNGAIFNHANLTDCKFVTSAMRNVSFEKTTFIGTIFDKSDLGETKFDMISLMNVSFLCMDLRNVSFVNCKIEGCTFQSCDLTAQTFRNVTIRNVQIGKAYLKNVSFEGCILQNVSFQPQFSLTGKYYRVISTMKFNDTTMDKLTYNALKGMGANLLNVRVM